jgi:hypothetical protein
MKFRLVTIEPDGTERVSIHNYAKLQGALDAVRDIIANTPPTENEIQIRPVMAS